MWKEAWKESAPAWALIALILAVTFLPRIF